jgi:hypothetical protein
MRQAYRALIAAETVLILCGLPAGTQARTNKTPQATVTEKEGPAVLWRDPKDIETRDLYYGPGGKVHEPRGTFTFEKEDMNGSSPKFEIVDEDGVKWKVKMGIEARPETVAARLVWAVGYFANEDYFMPVLHVDHMPRLHRGGNHVTRDGAVHDVRLKRHLKDEKKIGLWQWRSNPFTGTRELYGLRVLMAVINNWDLKDENNSLYQTRGDSPELRYMVSDLGASFGTTGLDRVSKGNLQAYTHSKWINSVSQEYVNFNVPSAPTVDHIFWMSEMVRRFNLVWIGRGIPRSDAKWMGNLLARLSSRQIRDAFRAAGYSAAEVEAFSQIVERRIQELERL